MTNNTIPNVPRELLERVLNAGWGSETVNALDDLRDFLESAPSPAGVDGLEVIGWHTEDHLDDKSATTYSREVADRWLAKGWPITGIANAADAQAIIDGLRGELEAAGEILAQQGRRNTELRKMRDQQATRVAVLEAFMRCIQRMPVDDEFAERIIELIDSALASPATDAWISVSERLPLADGQYWCFFSEEHPSTLKQRVCIFIERQQQFCDSTVTHWMPLPAAPTAHRDQGVPSAKS